MRNKIRYIRLIRLIFVLIVGSSLTFAQNKSKRKSAKKPLVEVVSIVTDEKGSPLKNVSIICGEGAVVLYTDAKGRFQTKVENDATVMVEALGYEDKVYKLLGSNIVPEKIVLKKEPLFLTEESLVNRADGGKTYKGNEVGATSVLENGQFGTFPDLTLTNMLQGKMLGLQVRSTVSGLGNNTPDLFIRGQHGMSENTAIVIIDGVERPAADLILVTFINRLIIRCFAYLYDLQYAYISCLVQVISYLIILVLDVLSLRLSFLNQLFLHPYQGHLILFQV